MNVYDFDGTIYDGDSTLDFYFTMCRKYPNVLLCLPRQAIAFLKYKWGKIDKTTFKQEFYSFLRNVEDVGHEVDLFWEENKKKIKLWYYDEKRNDDIIISASPEFLLKPVCNSYLGIEVIASKVNPSTGKYVGKNCYGKEKVNRFMELHKGDSIESFYSDSDSDYPLAVLAKQAFFVEKNTIVRWDKNTFNKKFKGLLI
ncbi:haloacid dehalogenase-like hydrolase [Pseudobutyrivibrio ruminis]|uniref:haloacid dehalogenase-like hydrolase n=1 Tax=Pseudobutyrivibrio ruminis TaxID=46206 RepID=UPI00040F6DD6|nr:haloacid dehalogenase-like hydrolase [Pseudobutyrivibrio ruminis]